MMNIASYIDHTILKPTTTLPDIEKLCEEAKQYHFAAVCVPPPYVKFSTELLATTSVKVATVVGFPFGYSVPEAKEAEIISGAASGADELDIVINLTAIYNEDWDYLEKEIASIMPIIRREKKIVKIIIETGILTEKEIIRCCELYSRYQVDYIKTSTGYAEKGATIEAVHLMRKHLPDAIKIKASGGIKTYEMAKLLIEAGASRIGSSAGVQIVKKEND